MSETTNDSGNKSGGDTADGAENKSAKRRFNRVESLLIKRGVVDADALEAAKDRQRGAKKPLVEVLVEQEAVDEALLVDVLAKATGMKVIPDCELHADPDVQKLVPAEVAQRLGMLPLHVQDDVLVVATIDPFQVVAFDELANRTQFRVQPVLARPSDLRSAMRGVRQGEDILHDLVKNARVSDLVVEVTPTTEGGPRAVHLTEEDAGPTIQLVNLIVADAIARCASDIHVEAEEAALRVRFRIDGELQEILSLPSSTTNSILSRIKIIGGLDIIETRRPQDGRAKVSHQEKTYKLRVSTIPSYLGEKAVIRILDATADTFSLDRAGLEPDVLRTWRDLIHRPSGLLLMTGPTGSGKTSTLFSSLLELRDPKLNIVTVEDPVEYQFPGIVHVPVRSDIGVTFAAALRSILRQDPDIVLVGEIRDAETAEVAVQAALTGHLVLSTLHTIDAFGAIPRLLDLGIDRGRLASCLAGVMAQRLTRTLCRSCATPHAYTEAELARIGWDVGKHGRPEHTRKGVGCRRCRGTGHCGRTAIAELLVMTSALSRLLVAGAEESELRAQAAEDGTRPLVEAGRRAVMNGHCSPEEILRVAAKELEAHNPESAERDSAPDADRSEADKVTKAPPRPAPPRSVQPESGPTEGASPARRACSTCEQDVQPEWKICPYCGEELTAPSDGPSVVLCDDDRTARKLASVALRKEFPNVREVANGEQALHEISRALPDLLVVDMLMPGLSGIDVIRELRSDLQTAALPIVMLTGSGDEFLEAESLEAGADDYLRKPIAPARLRARAKALVNARRRRAGLPS